MHLEKLEIQGFKSFAHKSILGFPGMLSKTRRGITAIVGPNGSGKSNIADAVRWALGEQSVKLLRGKKGEDVIFSGTENKGRLGMAQVSLFLNNNAQKASINQSEIVVTRRIFRDGASEYLINNARSRLIDVQLLLARARFGQRSYSVIGQGIVEGFLNKTVSERKEFFDEATGVKQFQIKRDNALLKIRASHDNLNQAQMILAEIEPRYKNLSKQVDKMRQKTELQKNLAKLQIKYYSRIWHEINNKFNEFNKKFFELDNIKSNKLIELKRINQELLEKEQNQSENEEFNFSQKELARLQNKKNEFIRQIAKLDVRIETNLEYAGKFDLSWLYSKKEELKKDRQNIINEINSLKNNYAYEEKNIEKISEKENIINNKIKSASVEMQNLSLNNKDSKQEGINKKIDYLLSSITKSEKIEDINKIKKVLEEIKAELKYFRDLFSDSSQKEKIDELENNIQVLNIEKEKIIIEFNRINLKIVSNKERVKLLSEKNLQLENELKSIEEKLNNNRSQENSSNQKTKQELKRLNFELSELESKIIIQKEKIDKYGDAEREKQRIFFKRQKEAQAVQANINEIQNKMNEIKINSTKYETRLEDLEIEIRSEFREENQVFNELELKEDKARPSLKIIKQTIVNGYIDTEAALADIRKIKRQLEFIGNIDEQVEKEYLEIKNRFNFLKNQSNDLSSTIQSLEKVVKNLDINIKEKFDNGFNIIKNKFSHYFKILFDGGEAEIVKVMADEENNNNELENSILKKYEASGIIGIDICATPPGKKIQSVNMLSGGERALTAIALICACLSSNPSPFVVLDEVDAALDESNSERLAKILDDLSHKTQFIAITHNRAIMRRANALYGVAMEDNGVSKLLSVKLDEVE